MFVLASCLVVGVSFASVPIAGDSKLFEAVFSDGIDPLTSETAPRCENGAALLEATRATTLRAEGPFVGDVAIEFAFAEPFDGDLVVRLLGAPDFAATMGRSASHLKNGERKFDVPAISRAKAFELRLRSQAAEVLLDGVPFAFAEFDAPLAGGPISLEVTPAVTTRLDSFSIRRLAFADRDSVSGLDAERAKRLATLPRESFRLLDTKVTRIDPLFRIAVEGEAEPIVASGRGIRPDESEIPLLDQALALSRIRPWLKFDLIDGEAQPDDLPLVRGEDGAYRITKKPGAIRVRGWCGVIGAWPVLMVSDLTRNRVLARMNPGGPASGEAWALIPGKCDKLRIALVVPDGPTVEHIVDVVRSE